MSSSTTNPLLFVCGPITNVTNGAEFNADVRRSIEQIIEHLESAGFDVLSAHREEKYGAEIPARSAEVFERDWRFARRSTAMVFVLPSDADGQLVRTDGTFMELGWAIALQKPLIIITDPDASGRSYLFDGFLDAAEHAHHLRFEEAADGRRLLDLIETHLSRHRKPPARSQSVAMSCPSCGYGALTDGEDS